MSPDQLKRLIVAHGQGPRMRGEPIKSPGGTRAWLDARNKDDEGRCRPRRPPRRGRLPEERVRRFPADQVILLDEKREYEVRRDDVMKTHEPARLAGRGAGRPARAGPRSRTCSPMPCCRPRGGPPGAGAAGPADRPAAARRGPAAVRRRARRQAAARSCPTSRAAARRPVHRQAVPLRASTGPPPTSAAPRRRATRRTPASTSITS